MNIGQPSRKETAHLPSYCCPCGWKGIQIEMYATGRDYLSGPVAFPTQFRCPTCGKVLIENKPFNAFAGPKPLDERFTEGARQKADSRLTAIMASWENIFALRDRGALTAWEVMKHHDMIASWWAEILHARGGMTVADEMERNLLRK